MTVASMSDRGPYDTGPDDGLSVPPHDIATERAVLGAMMLSPDALAACLAMLTEQAFLRPAHQLILAAIRALADRSEPVDWLTVKAELERRGDTAMAGGPLATSDMAGSAPAGANGPWYAKRLLEFQSQRDGRELSIHIRQLADDPGLSPGERLARISTRVDDVAARTAGRPEPATAATLIGPLIEALEAGPESIIGVPSPWSDLNDVIPAFRAGEVIVVGGGPAMGKSVVLLQIAAHAAIHLGLDVLAVTLEMSAEQYMERLLAAESGVDLHRIVTRTLTDADWDKVARAHKVIGDATTLRILRSGDLSPAGIHAELTDMRRAGRAAAMVSVDYLQLMEAAMARESRQLDVAGLSRSLKKLALDWEIPVLVGSQLNRGPDLRADHTPVMADLRESGAIENDADNVILLYRDEAYDRESARAGEIDLIVDKNRQGVKTTVTLAWRGHVARCDDLAKVNWTPHSSVEAS